jgi:hypothetical protein
MVRCNEDEFVFNVSDPNSSLESFGQIAPLDVVGRSTDDQ